MSCSRIMKGLCGTFAVGVMALAGAGAATELTPEDADPLTKFNNQMIGAGVSAGVTLLGIACAFFGYENNPARNQAVDQHHLLEDGNRPQPGQR